MITFNMQRDNGEGKVQGSKFKVQNTGMIQNSGFKVQNCGADSRRKPVVINKKGCRLLDCRRQEK
jgi:hypothetical protein